MHHGITFQNMSPTILQRVINKTTSNDESNQSNQNPVVTIWVGLPYCGDIQQA